MNSRAKKITPLFFILLMTLSVFTYTPTATTSSETATPQIQASHNPAIIDWTRNATSYAIYNGHWSEWRDDYYSGWSKKDIIMKAKLGVIPNGAKTIANLTADVYEFFTGLPELGMEGIWYNISTNGGTFGKVVAMENPTSGLLGNYSFFYVRTMSNLNVGSYLYITSPFDNHKSLRFKVNMTETVLGIDTKVLNVTYKYGPVAGYSRETNIVFWISNNTQGLLMRMIGYDSEDYTGVNWYHRRLDMSLEIGQTNILDLTPPSIPKGVVPWMKTGKYIQYNLQGSGYIDARFTNHSSGVTWQLPGDTKFRTTISANLTLKVDRGTTAYVDPYHSSRYVWVLHLMLNNTNLQLPDLRRTIQYLNSTGIEHIPYPEAADYVIGVLAPFNHTGLVKDAWFLVDNASGQMYWPGVHFSSLAGFSPSTTETLGELLSEGLGLQILSWFAQSYMYQGWGFSNPPGTGTIHQVIPSSHSTETIDGTLAASIACVGTEYLNFPGGGGGHTWRINANLNSHITASSIMNRSYHPPATLSPGVFMDNSTNDITGSGFLNIERTSGFPLAFGLNLRFTSSGEPRFLPYYWYSTYFDVSLALSATVPRTNIWFSNPPVNLILGVGANGTLGYMDQYGYDVWVNGNGEIQVTTSASQPPETGVPPSGTLPLVYMDINRIVLNGSEQVILYVFYNKTRVLSLGIDENSLKFYTYNATTHNWDVLPSTHLVLNSTHGVLFAVLPHLSYFAVLGSPSAGAGGLPTLYIIVAAVAIIAVLAAVVYLRKGKSKGGLK